MKQKNFYQKPEACVVAHECEKPLAISAGLSDFEENEDEWGDDNGGAKEAFFGYEDEEGGWFN